MTDHRDLRESPVRSNDESRESGDEFLTAAEYYGLEEPQPRDYPEDAPNFAKTIIWYDPATPLYVCEKCYPDVVSIRHSGSREVAHPDEIRSVAYRRLLTQDPVCDACSGTLETKLDR